MKAIIALGGACLCFANIPLAEPATLTLACKGTMTSMSDEEPTPVSMGIIVNFTTGTVQGFGYPGLIDFPAKITAANDVAVAFFGEQELLPTAMSSIRGAIDRVTGDVDAISTTYDTKTNKTISQTNYSLQCRPVGRSSDPASNPSRPTKFS